MLASRQLPKRLHPCIPSGLSVRRVSGDNNGENRPAGAKRIGRKQITALPIQKSIAMNHSDHACVPPRLHKAVGRYELACYSELMLLYKSSIWVAM
jgi:hypothetical protein